MTSRLLHPPRAAVWLAHAAIRDDDWRDVTLGDLREEFAALSETRGLRTARRWYWRQVFGLAGSRAADAVLSFLRSPGDGFMRTWLHDARIAVRSLARRPLAAAIVLITLALGLGANAATFNMIDVLLLRPFPIKDVDRLVVFSENSPSDMFPKETISPGAYFEWKTRVTTFPHMAAFRWWDANLSDGDRAERIQGYAVTPEFFPMLGATAQLGRLLQPSDLAWGNHKQIVLSDGLWRRRFNARPEIVGSPIRVDGEPYTVIGVAPPRFDYPDGSDAWAPMAMSPKDAVGWTDHHLTVIAALPPGGSLDSAQAEMATIYEQQRQAQPDGTRGRQLVVRSFSAAMVDIGMPQVLYLWQAAAAFVLLIACTNIASLLIARAAERQHEMAVRLAIGAGRAQIMRQLLVESLALALIAVPAALGVAVLIVNLLKSAMPATLVRYVAGWQQLGIDGRTIGFTIAAAAVASLIFGLLPAVHASRVQLTSSITDGSRSMSAGRSRTRLRRGLVIAEIALALPLLVVSALSAVGANRFANGPQGYDPDGLVRMRMLLPEAQYQDAAARTHYIERLLENVSAIPNIERFGTTSIVPALSSNQSRVLKVDGVPEDKDAPITVSFRAVSADYLATMRIPLRSGRTIMTGDRVDTERVVLVSESLARQHLGEGVVIGRRIRIGADDKNWATVIGVTGDVIDDWFANRHTPTVYVPMTQMPSTSVVLVARTTGDPAQLSAPLRAAVARTDPTVPPFTVMTMRDALYERTTGLRFIASLMAGFGVLALVLAACGIYAIMAHFVVSRRHEMGVRMALGATAPQILRLTLGQAGKLTAIGLVLGAAGALAFARLMESTLFGVVSLDAPLFGTITFALAAVALLASLLPARQASRVNAAGLLRR